MTSLWSLHVDTNPDLADIQPLLDNTGLGAGDCVSVRSTGVSGADVDAMKARGVNVTTDCP